MSDLRLCLESLSHQKTSYNYEVIVVDGGSEGIEDLKAEFQTDWLMWLSTDTANPYTSRNIGVNESRGKSIGFLDAKCIPCDDWINQAMKTLLTEEKAIVAGHYEVFASSESLRDQVYGLLYLNNKKNASKGYGVTTGNLWVHKRAFIDLGPFADDFISGNDILWTKKALKNGYEIRYAEQAAVSYHGQSYKRLISSTKKYFTGIAIQHKNEKNTFLYKMSYAVKQLLPMRLSNFQESMDYRGLKDKSWFDKAYLWFIIWRVKIHMAFTYIKRLITL